MRTAVFLLAVLVAAPVGASQPGNPLDCSDWVFLEPGLSCSVFVPYPCNVVMDYLCYRTYGNGSVDNEGHLLYVPETEPISTPCGVLPRLKLVRYDGTNGTTIAYLDSRCVSPTRKDMVGHSETGPMFDPVSGVVLLSIPTYCQASDGSCTYPTDMWNGWVARFSGFTTLFDVLQSFTPSANALGFRVPLRPEGLNGATHFDTYWGDLASVGDWSAAQGLECGYPATTPNAGDRLEVTDTLPTPGPGRGYYYVTAAHFMGETRYGRRVTNGHLTGRDPAVLPACQGR